MIRLLAGLLLLCMNPVWGVDSVRVSIEKGIAQNFTAWVNEAGGDCTRISRFNSQYATRAAVEMVLLCQALRKGGFTGKINLVVVPNYARAVREAEIGTVDMPSESMWDVDIDPKKFYVTSPIIRRGEFEKGIYISPAKQGHWQIQSLNDLRALKAAMSSLWVVDWKTLKDMGIRIGDTPTEESIFKMLLADRADFTILEFTHLPGMQQSFLDQTLVPLPGVKISLDGERSFVVSRSSPNGELVYGIFSAGLYKLVKAGVVQRAWVESGFFNASVRNWRDLRKGAIPAAALVASPK